MDDEQTVRSALPAVMAQTLLQPAATRGAAATHDLNRLNLLTNLHGHASGLAALSTPVTFLLSTARMSLLILTKVIREPTSFGLRFSPTTVITELKRTEAIPLEAAGPGLKRVSR